MRLAKIFLVAILVAGIVFSSSGGFVVLKVKAATPPAPSGNDWLTFRFTSTDKQIIQLDYNSGNLPNGQTNPVASVTFTNLGQMTDTGQIKNLSAVTGAGITRNYWRYQIQNGSQNVYVITGQKADSVANLLCGIYYQDSLGYHTISNINPTFATFSWPSSFTRYAASATSMANHQPGSYVVTISGSPTQNCSSLQNLWQSYIQGFNSLFGKPAQDNSQYWQTKGAVSTGTAVANSFSSDDFIAMFTPTGSAFAIGKMFTSAAWNAVQNRFRQYTAGFELNASGINVALQMRQEADSMIQILESFKQSDGGWPSSVSNCAPYLVDENFQLTTTPFASPQDMEDAINALVIKFQSLVAQQSQPAANGDGCGNLIGSVATKGFGVILQLAVCEIGVALHWIANGVMTKAFYYLSQSLGVDAPNFKFDEVKTDKSSSAPVTNPVAGNTTLSGTTSIPSGATTASHDNIVTTTFAGKCDTSQANRDAKKSWCQSDPTAKASTANMEECLTCTDREDNCVGSSGLYTGCNRPTEYFAALPLSSVAAACGGNVNKCPRLVVEYNGKSVIVAVLDTGPWNRSDSAYVLNGSRPQAESQGGTNKAGLDLSEAAMNAIGASSGAKVKWHFTTGSS